MKQEEKSILDRATYALRADVPDNDAITASATKSAQRLGIQMNPEVFSGAIRNCDDVRQLLDAYSAKVVLKQQSTGRGLALRLGNAPHSRRKGALKHGDGRLRFLARCWLPRPLSTKHIG